MTVPERYRPDVWKGRSKRSSLLALSALLIAGTGVQTGHAQAVEDPWPDTPPAQICGNSALLAGPATAPSGAITVPAGDNSQFNFNQPGATFWFESGVHTLGNDIYHQITARDNTTYVGAPGAVIDGQNINRYAFTSSAEGVTIKYLTIKNFGSGLDNNNEGVVNHDAGDDWTIEYNTITLNDGAGVFLGSGNVVRYNCLKDNGQYGFSMYKPPVEGQSAIYGVVLDHNEIAGNNTDDWESRIDGCGCTGGGKFWDVQGATVTGNWVHHNKGTGLWADTNNIDFLFEGNYINDNDGEGIWYEISYNATIRNNTFKQNAWASGQRNTGSPAPAVYLSESGGDARLASTVSGSPTIRIYDNRFTDNFSGVSIYENANRFCNSNGNTSKGYCTPFVSPTLIAEPHDYEYPNPISTTHPCYTGITTAPYTNDCRWHSKNIEVNDNLFEFDDTVVPCAGEYCGAQALIATGADNMPWAPPEYSVANVQNAVMFTNNNHFHDNTYVGAWRFAKGYGEAITFTAWRAAPFNQDAGSTITGDTFPGGGGGGGGGTTGTPATNHLDADTAGLEGSIGHWDNWYSTAVAQSTEQAHGGTHGLRVNITDPWGWAVQQNNWPGFSADHGVKTIGFWARIGNRADLQPKLVVKWLDGNQALLQTDQVAVPTLTTTWQNVRATVDAPAGTATALVQLMGSAGTTGDYFYVDDLFVGQAANALNVDSAGFEGSVGEWQNWYSTSLATSATAAWRGSNGLQVTVTDAWGWAAELGNSPGFEATPGVKRVSYWAKQGTGDISKVTLNVSWIDSGNSTIRTDPVQLSTLTTSWQQAGADLTAPAGTAAVQLTLLSSSGDAGETVLIDDIVITDK
jgi:parallel beta-helix repeat protein